MWWCFMQGILGIFVRIFHSIFYYYIFFLLKTIHVVPRKMLLSITLSFRSWGLVRMFNFSERSLCSISNYLIKNTVKTVIFWKCFMNVMAAESSADNTPVFHMIIQKLFKKWLIWCNKYFCGNNETFLIKVHLFEIQFLSLLLLSICLMHPCWIKSIHLLF